MSAGCLNHLMADGALEILTFFGKGWCWGVSLLAEIVVQKVLKPLSLRREAW